MKDVRSNQGGRRFVQCGHFLDKWEGRFFRCGRSYFLAQKSSDFLKFMVCPHGQRGKGINFSRFCAASFMDGP